MELQTEDKVLIYENKVDIMFAHQAGKIVLDGIVKKISQKVNLPTNYDKFGKEKLKRGFIVGRPFPPYYDWCRISTGTSQEVDKFVSAMLDIYS